MYATNLANASNASSASSLAGALDPSVILGAVPPPPQYGAPRYSFDGPAWTPGAQPQTAFPPLPTRVGNDFDNTDASAFQALGTGAPPPKAPVDITSRNKTRRERAKERELARPGLPVRLLAVFMRGIINLGINRRCCPTK